MRFVTKYRLQILLILGAVAAGFGVLFIWFQMRGIIQVGPFLDLGFMKLQLYSFTALAGILTALFIADRLRARSSGMEKVDVWEAALYALIPGIIGARVYHVLTDWNLYVNDPVSALYLWNGGLGIIGGVLGGMLGLYVFCRRYGLKFDQIAAIAAAVMPLGQAIGRLGNMFNRELFGFPTDLPWAQYIAPQFNRYPQFAGITYFHPAFLYEAVANIILFAVLIKLWRGGWRSWDLVLVYLCGYGLIRFMMDFGRIEGHDYALGATAAQLLFILFLAALATFYFAKWLRLRHES
jgi:phosphatidylglycerol---prolipoprotein diacylglyceryl transferase